eukprot:gnl/Ergobibamus_cyprinoides/1293.p1 GENE.gnl/Ergobibamus_cyprinoides/1293~~gnl/Ergobibamus_cyprinoides/1293.p1  ORF type:complete len:141 (+),score=24.43 gnl/Ergobibamus_cyprinoides/1293:30-425(+)
MGSSSSKPIARIEDMEGRDRYLTILSKPLAQDTQDECDVTELQLSDELFAVYRSQLDAAVLEGTIRLAATIAFDKCVPRSRAVPTSVFGLPVPFTASPKLSWRDKQRIANCTEKFGFQRAMVAAALAPNPI